MLKQRLITAFLIGPPILWAIYSLSNSGFSIFMLLLVGLGVFEWANFCQCKNRVQHYIFIIVALLILTTITILQDTEVNQLVLALALLWWFACLLLLRHFPFSSHHFMHNRVFRALLGIILLAATMLSMSLLRQNQDYGVPYVIYVLILIWTADSAAYFVGRAFGKRKLMPKVSPGKSWEGVLGALLATIIAALIALDILQVEAAKNSWFVLLSVITVIFSIAGDLSESMFKRMVGLKDSGKLLPGHGGVLDRIDSLMAAFPVFLAGLWLMESFA